MSDIKIASSTQLMSPHFFVYVGKFNKFQTLKSALERVADMLRVFLQQMFTQF